MRATLSDDDISDEDKKVLIEKWYVCFNAEGKEKKAGLSSSKNEKKELQASKCQASSSNELGCKDTCLFVDLRNEVAGSRVEAEVRKAEQGKW